MDIEELLNGLFQMFELDILPLLKGKLKGAFISFKNDVKKKLSFWFSKKLSELDAEISKLEDKLNDYNKLEQSDSVKKLVDETNKKRLDLLTKKYELTNKKNKLGD